MPRASRRSLSLERSRARWLGYVISWIMLAALLPAPLVQPVAAQSDGPTYSVSVLKYECPANAAFDPYMADLGTLLSGCNIPHLHVPFTLSTNNPSYPGSTRTTSEDDDPVASWVEIPFGSQFTLQEQIPPGYGLPMIGCLAYGSAFDPSSGTANPGFSFGQGSVSAVVTEAFASTPMIGCYWFNVPLSNDQGEPPVETEGVTPESDEPGLITVSKLTCWLSVAPTIDDLEDFLENYQTSCSPGFAGARFEVTGHETQSYTLEPNNSFSALNDGSGSVEIVETHAHWPHPRLAVTVCAIEGFDGQSFPMDVQVIEDGKITYDLPAGYSLTCAWYNVFVPSTVVQKYTCPDDADYRELPIPVLQGRCTLVNGVDFLLSQEPWLVDLRYATGESGHGTAIWPLNAYHLDGQPGDLLATTISEMNPTGYPYQRVHCSTVLPGGNPTDSYSAVVETGSISYDHPYRAQVACAWFNIPAYGDETVNGAPPTLEPTELDGTVAVAKYVCDADYPVGDDWPVWLQECGDLPGDGFEFTLTGQGYSENRTTDFTRLARWDNAPTGTLNINEAPVGGLITGAVFCGVASAGQAPDEFLENVVFNDTIQATREAGEAVACLWFNIPDGTAALPLQPIHQLALVKIVCGPNLPVSDSLDDWLNCEDGEFGPGVGFTLSTTTGYESTEATNLQGSVRWLSQNGSEVKITEAEIPGLEPVALFCTLPVGGTETLQPVRIPINGQTSEPFNWPAANSVECYWFNAAVVLPAEPGDGNVVTLYKYVCGDTYPTSMTYADWFNACPAIGTGFGIELRGPNSYSSMKTTDAGGYASWEDAPYGELTFVEQGAPGYQPGALFCGAAQGTNPPQSVGYIEMFDRASAPIQRAEGASLVCAMFNIPVEMDEHRVSVIKYVCDQGYPQSTMHSDWTAQCTTPGEGFAYSLQTLTQYVGAGVTNQQGRYVWENAPYGPLRIIEEPRKGYLPVALFCGLSQGDTMPQTWEWLDIDYFWMGGYDRPDGTSLTCVWFNTPVELGVIEVIKYDCEPGYDPSMLSKEYLESICPVKPGIVFDYQDTATGGDFGVTDSAGYVSWDDVQPGRIAISESFYSDRPGYRPFKVYCALSPLDGSLQGAYTDIPLSQSMIRDYELPSGYRLTCHWFNERFEYGYVSIFKYDCEPGYDAAMLSQEYLLGYCAPAPDVRFRITESGWSPPDNYTDTTGSASWDTVPFGLLTIRELDRPGYVPLKVYCYEAPFMGGGVVPFSEVPMHGWEIEWQLSPAHGLTCYWFNERATANGVARFYKYFCDSGYDPSMLSQAYLAGYCTPEQGVTFGFGDATGHWREATSDAAGSVSFSDVAAGVVYGGPHSTPGTQVLAAYCALVPRTNSVTALYEAMPFDLDGYYIFVPNGYDLTCYFYNVAHVEPGYLDLYKYDCGPGYDATMLSKEYLESYCSPAPNVTFDYTDGMNPGDTGMTGVGGLMRVQLNPGPVYITEQARPGYSTLAVYCAAVPRTNDTTPMYMEVPATGSSITYDLPAGYDLRCSWFNAPHVEPGKLLITKHRCEEPFDLNTVTYQMLTDYYCNPLAHGIRFDVTWGDGATDWGNSTDSGPLELISTAAGPVTIVEQVPTGYILARVYCTYYPAATGMPMNPEWVEALQGTSQAWWNHLAPGYVLHCRFFNMPYEDTGYGKVTVYKRLCPEPYNHEMAMTDPGYHTTHCTQPHAGIEFSLATGAPPARSATTDLDGVVTWLDVPAGMLLIEESAPGYTTVRVTCSAYPRDGMPGEHQGVSVHEAKGISYDLPAGYSLACYWYNVPHRDPGHVTILKYNCPEGYDHHAIGKSYLDSWCSDHHEGVEFDLTHESTPLMTLTTGSAPSYVVWGVVYGGALHLYEHVPPGYKILRVYCSAYPAQGAPGEFSSMTIHEAASVYYNLPHGYALVCHWYNTPVGAGWIEVTKYACPEGFNPTHATSHDLANACHQRLEHVPFYLDRHDGGPSLEETTDTLGQLRFDPVAYNVPFDLVEEYPAAYSRAIVYCSRYTPYTGAEGPYEQYAVYNGAITVTLDHSEYLKCRWYNLRTEYGVTIRVTKYACHDSAWDLPEHQLLEQCNTPMHHVLFHARSGPERVEGKTSPHGLVVWEGLPAGLIRIEETPPSGYGNRIRVYCRVHDGGQTTVWQPAGVLDGIAIEYGMMDRATLECYWFNFPVAEHGAHVTVYKYLCPAHADSHSTSLNHLKAKCVPLAGIKLTLAAAGQPGLGRITGANGMTYWQAVPAGHTVISESYLHGYKTPVVYCKLNDAHAVRTYSAGASVSYQVGEGDQLRCYWFNIPEPPPHGTWSGETGGQPPATPQPTPVAPAQGTGPATLTIVKLVCAPHYDLDGPESDPALDCDAGDSPVQFSIRPWDNPTGAPAVTVTSAEPEIDRVTFSDLDPMEYVLTELAGDEDDIAWAFVLSCVSSLGQTDSSRFFPLALTRENLSLRLTLFPGEHLTCYWYNVPGGGIPVSVTVTVYECPGQVANPIQCSPAASPKTVAFTPVDPLEEPVLVETGDLGTVETDVPIGDYTIEALGATNCLIYSNVLTGNNLHAIDGSEAVEVVIYTCAA